MEWNARYFPLHSLSLSMLVRLHNENIDVIHTQASQLVSTEHTHAVCVLVSIEEVIPNDTLRIHTYTHLKYKTQTISFQYKHFCATKFFEIIR